MASTGGEDPRHHKWDEAATDARPRATSSSVFPFSPQRSPARRPPIPVDDTMSVLGGGERWREAWVGKKGSGNSVAGQSASDFGDADSDEELEEEDCLEPILNKEGSPEPIYLVNELPHVHVERVTEQSYYSLPTLGVLFVTNYRIVFLPYSIARVDYDEGEPVEQLELPLGAIDHLQKIGGRRSGSTHNYCLDIIGKDFRVFRFGFIPSKKFRHRKKVFDAVMRLAFPGDPERSFAFSYELKAGARVGTDGWSIFDATEEFERQKAKYPVLHEWRVASVNQNYELAPTYPRILIIPAAISDDEIRRVAEFRSRGRIPVLSWIHPTNYATITRCSQPRVGFGRARCEEDERLLDAIRVANSNGMTLHILDARPRVNAMANQAKGAGYELSKNYSSVSLEFLDIDNIHVMRESHKKLRDVCLGDDQGGWYGKVEASGWLEHIRFVLSGALHVVKHVEKMGESVLVHCSDGWDRTAQLTSLAMLMLDPFYRTIHGFEVLIEKEWLSFGYMFQKRVGHVDPNFQDQQRSPIFQQFIDCVFQLLHQFPCSFEFNEVFLHGILEHVYSCRFGTFLYNCERERMEAHLSTRTVSLWTYMYQHMRDILNPFYHPTSRVLLVRASTKVLCVWSSYYLRFNHRLHPVESKDEIGAKLVNRIHEVEEEVKNLRAVLAIHGLEVPSSSPTHSPAHSRQGSTADVAVPRKVPLLVATPPSPLERQASRDQRSTTFSVKGREESF